jgi:hypothetical protein
MSITGPRALCREVATRITSMTDWIFAQEDPSEELAKLHFFAIKKHEPGGNVEFTITVHEYIQRNALNMRFFAQADKHVNQEGAPFTPFGWGETLLEALSECVHIIRQYPYQGEISGV